MITAWIATLVIYLVLKSADVTHVFETPLYLHFDIGWVRYLCCASIYSAAAFVMLGGVALWRSGVAGVGAQAFALLPTTLWFAVAVLRSY